MGFQAVSAKISEFFGLLECSAIGDVRGVGYHMLAPRIYVFRLFGQNMVTFPYWSVPHLVFVFLRQIITLSFSPVTAFCFTILVFGHYCSADLDRRSLAISNRNRSPTRCLPEFHKNGFWCPTAFDCDRRFGFSDG